MGPQDVHKNYINAFPAKILIGGSWVIFGPKMACPGSILMIFLKNLHNESGQEVHQSCINSLNAIVTMI